MCELLLAQLNRPHDTAYQVILIQPGINRCQVTRILKVDNLKILHRRSQHLEPLGVLSPTPNLFSYCWTIPKIRHKKGQTEENQQTKSGRRLPERPVECGHKSEHQEG